MGMRDAAGLTPRKQRSDWRVASTLGATTMGMGLYQSIGGSRSWWEWALGLAFLAALIGVALVLTVKQRPTSRRGTPDPGRSAGGPDLLPIVLSFGVVTGVLGLVGPGPPAGLSAAVLATSAIALCVVVVGRRRSIARRSNTAFGKPDGALQPAAATADPLTPRS